MRVCSLPYPACRAHAPYYTVISGLSARTQYFSALSHKRKKSSWTQNMSFDWLWKVWNISHSKNNSERYNHKCTVHWSSCEAPFILLRFSWQIFEKYSNITFNENLSSRSRVVRCGQTDGRTDGQTDRCYEPKSGCTLFCVKCLTITTCTLCGNGGISQLLIILC